MPPALELWRTPPKRSSKLVDRLIKIGAVCMLVFMSMTLIVGPAVAVNRGYWKNVGADPSYTDIRSMKYYFQWHSSDGTAITDDLVLNGETIRAGKTEAMRHAPDTAPDGWELDSSQANNSVTPNEAVANTAIEGKKISEVDPPFELSARFIMNVLTKFMFNLIRGLTDAMVSISEWALSLMGTQAGASFTSDFKTGAYEQFYAVAQRVSSTVVAPVATALLAMVFGMGMMSHFDPRRQRTGSDRVAALFVHIAAFVVAYTLITHALTVCGGIYWVAQVMTGAVRRVIEAMGLGGVGAGVLRGTLMGHLDTLTYENSATMFVVAIAAIATVIACLGCCISVITTIFLRIGEIYLRAAMSPLCFAFFTSDRTRPLGVSYLKRFAAVCVQAVVIFVALGLIPLFFTVATAFITDIASVGSTPGEVAGAWAAFGGSLLPMMCAILCITKIVSKSEVIASQLFGLS